MPGKTPAELPAKALVRLAGLIQRNGLLKPEGSGTLPSPCIGICRMGTPAEESLCLGCYRSIEEIMDWRNSTEETKRHVWHAILERAGL